MWRMRFTLPTAAVTTAAQTAAEVAARGHTAEYKQCLSRGEKNSSTGITIIYTMVQMFLHSTVVFAFKPCWNNCNDKITL